MGVVYAAHDDRLDRAGRDQADPRGSRRRRPAGAAAARGARRRQRQSPQHLPRLRARRRRRRALPRHGAARRRAARRADRPRAGAARRSARDRPRHPRGARGAARPRHRPPRPEAVEHLPHPHGVKLLDFGLARPLVEQLKTDVTLTAPGTIVGTPRYMPPEQWEGEPFVPASDLFAVGAILFEMLAGKPAFRAARSSRCYRAVAMAQPPALTGGSEVVAADRIIQLRAGQAAGRPVSRRRGDGAGCPRRAGR